MTRARTDRTPSLILWNPTTGLEETWSIDMIWKDIGGFGHFVDFEKY
jgi:hypothetical protein